MAESKTSWFLKTIGLVVVAAVATSLLTYWLQMMIWGEANGGLSGGAAAGVAVAVAMSQRSSLPADKQRP